MSETSQALKDARELISDPINWTQEAFARDVRDIPVPTWGEHACSWCAIGALRKVCGNEISYINLLLNEDSPLFLLHRESHARFGVRFIQTVNDRLGHEAVLEVFDAVIEGLEKQAND